MLYWLRDSETAVAMEIGHLEGRKKGGKNGRDQSNALNARREDTLQISALEIVDVAK